MEKEISKIILEKLPIMYFNKNNHSVISQSEYQRKCEKIDTENWDRDEWKLSRIYEIDDLKILGKPLYAGEINVLKLSNGYCFEIAWYFANEFCGYDVPKIEKELKAQSKNEWFGKQAVVVSEKDENILLNLETEKPLATEPETTLIYPLDLNSYQTQKINIEHFDNGGRCVEYLGKENKKIMVYEEREKLVE